VATGRVGNKSLEHFISHFMVIQGDIDQDEKKRSCKALVYL